MRPWLLLLAFLAVSCAPAPPAPQPAGPVPEQEVEAEEPLSEGSGGTDDAQAPERATGLPGIDRAQELEVRILDAHGTGWLSGEAVPGGQSLIPSGKWLLSDAGSEYEIAVRGAMAPGIVRLDGRSAFLVEDLEHMPRFRVFSGHASFYFPSLPAEALTVLTPVGLLTTTGSVFSVTISADGRVLITCREGAVYLTGAQNAAVVPGQVLVADRWGRGQAYAMTPNEADVFAGRWLLVMNEEAPAVLKTLLPLRLKQWRAAAALRDAEQQRFLALWFRDARAVLGTDVPGAELWGSALSDVHPSVWHELLQAPGLLGEEP